MTNNILKNNNNNINNTFLLKEKVNTIFLSKNIKYSYTSIPTLFKLTFLPKLDKEEDNLVEIRVDLDLWVELIDNFI